MSIWPQYAHDLAVCVAALASETSEVISMVDGISQSVAQSHVLHQDQGYAAHQRDRGR